MAQQLLHLLAGALLTLVLQMAAGFLGVGGVLLNLLTPLPAAYAHLRQGAVVGGGIVLLATAALFPLAGPGTAVGYLLQFGLGSFILPLLLRRGWPWDRAVAAALAAAVVAGLLVLGGYVASRGVPVTETVHHYIRAEIDRALTASRSADLPAGEALELEVFADRTVELLTRIYPGLAVTVCGAVLLLTVVLLARFGRYPLSGPPFHLWKAPEMAVWPLIAAGFAAIFAGGALQTGAFNVLAVLLPLYFLQGLAVVSFFFRQKGISPLLRGVGYLLLAVLNPFPLIVAGIGVFDLWADFRKPRIKKT